MYHIQMFIAVTYHPLDNNEVKGEKIIDNLFKQSLWSYYLPLNNNEMFIKHYEVVFLPWKIVKEEMNIMAK